MVLTTLLFAMRNVSTKTLVSWSSQSTTDVGRGRRSTDSSSSPQPSEYVNVNCNLMCIIETQGEESHRQILVCTSGNKKNHRKGIPVRTTCVEHASADYLDNDFAKAVQDALHTMTPEPETLYLTIEIPLLILHQNDFAALSSKVRRLSIYLGHAVHVDPNVLTALSLESFSFEGCRLKKTRVFQNESQHCDANFIYTCPKIGEFVLSVDRTGWARLCSESPYNHSNTQHFEKQSESAQLCYETSPTLALIFMELVLCMSINGNITALYALKSSSGTSRMAL
ncbi:hypothetical protein TcWFU_008886 [Taenia crassiceps]|uniref:Uncharacterized protein n=1 Tax=Taenia crassiceps TaxID=6207 RepID=A0ABR4QSW4_9CEST